MKTATQAMADFLQGEAVTLATFWKITRNDGTQIGFTDHDQNLSVAFGSPSSTITYSSALGYAKTSLKSSVDLSVDTLEVIGIIDASGISADDLRAGKYDYATVEIGVVNWRDLSMGVVYMRRGHFGEVTLRDEHYLVELRGLTQLLTREVASIYTAECPRDLGDSECTINLAGTTQDGTNITQSGTVTAVTSSQTFRASGLTGVADFFVDGVLTWNGVLGALNLNSGRKMEVALDTIIGGGIRELELFLGMPRPVQVGDVFSLSAGCNKLITHCSDKFGVAPNGNILNYRGFATVPTRDEALTWPDGLIGGVSAT